VSLAWELTLRGSNDYRATSEGFDQRVQKASLLSTTSICRSKSTIHALIAPRCGKTDVLKPADEILPAYPWSDNHEGATSPDEKPSEDCAFGHVRSFRSPAIFPESNCFARMFRVAFNAARGESYDFCGLDRGLSKFDDQGPRNISPRFV